MININFVVPTLSDLIVEMKKFLADVELKPIQHPLDVGPTPSNVVPIDRAKRGRPPKVEPVPATTTASQPAATASVTNLVPNDPFITSPATVTFEQMKSALQDLAQLRPGDVGNAGMVRVQEVLKKYDCKNPAGQAKISLVKPQDFAAIVADCEKATLAMEGKTA